MGANRVVDAALSIEPVKRRAVWILPKWGSFNEGYYHPTLSHDIEIESESDLVLK